MSIRISNLRKKYNSFGKDIVALGGINLNFKDVELVAIIGESGSGKTTLLNQLCGMDTPDGGEILLDGIDLTRLSPNELCKMRRTKIGVVYQFYNLIPELNVRDNVTLPVELNGDRIDEVKAHNYRQSYTFRSMPIEQRIAKKSVEYYKSAYRSVGMTDNGIKRVLHYEYRTLVLHTFVYLVFILAVMIVLINSFQL